jgi:gliding-associated putative ABC transporter substrate-binding component GldG
MYQNKQQAITRVLIILGIIIVVNVLFFSINWRLDFTADKRYTLSETTKASLKNLEEPLTITAYFSEKLPADIQLVKNDFRHLLEEYSKYSGNKVVFSFVNPQKDSRTQKQVEQKGIIPQIHNMRKKDKFEQQQVYLGAEVQYGENSEIIPAIQPGAPMEYALTFAIRKISTNEKPSIAIIKGHGEAGFADLSYVNEALSALYQLQEFELTDESTIPPHIKTIAIINPVDSFSPKQLEEISSFMGAGGSVFIAHGYVKGDLSGQPPKSYINATGLENWLQRYGILLKKNLVIDEQSTQITVQQRQGNYVINTPLNFPYIPFFSTFGDHLITKGMESMLIPFASEIEFVHSDTSIKAYPLVFTSEFSGVELAPANIDITRQWNRQNFNRSRIPIAYAIEGNLVGNTPSKLVVISNGEFALNDQQGRFQGTPDNINFFAGAVDWLSDESGLADLRTKTISARPIKQISDRKKNSIKYLNVLLPILIIVIIGIVRVRIQKNKVRKWKQG